MPIYEYRCRNGHEFEVFQSMSEDPISRCQECGAPVERVFHPVAVHFKGSGFYTTDYGGGKRSDGTGSASSESKKESDGKKSEKKDSGDSGGEKAKASSADD
jgi:putative FmdB family regulatory protein